MRSHHWSFFCGALAVAAALAACPPPAPPAVAPNPVAPPVPSGAEGPPAAAVRIPPGCEADLSGAWVHAQNASYRYAARDDGGTLELALIRSIAPPPPAPVDAGQTPDAGDPVPWAELSPFGRAMIGWSQKPAAAEPTPAASEPAPADDAFPPDASVRVTLLRSPAGFAGTTHATGFTPAGVACPIDFPTEVFACTDGGLTIRSAAKAAIDEACQSPARPGPPVMVEHRLVRAPATAPALDAGSH